MSFFICTHYLSSSSVGRLQRDNKSTVKNGRTTAVGTSETVGIPGYSLTFAGNRKDAAKPRVAAAVKRRRAFKRDNKSTVKNGKPTSVGTLETVGNLINLLAFVGDRKDAKLAAKQQRAFDQFPHDQEQHQVLEVDSNLSLDLKRMQYQEKKFFILASCFFLFFVFFIFPSVE